MDKAFLNRIQLWSPDKKHARHRIPGMLVTRKGTLLAYCEARSEGSDWALMDVLLQRSEDHGKTFQPPFLLAQGNETHKTVNNPVMMQDHTGRIHFLYCEDYTVNGGRALRRYSDDDGITWSDPVDVTEYTLPDDHNAFAFGPGHGITLKDGTLLVPVWMVPKHHNAPLTAHAPSVLSTFYSKDNGETWALGEILDSNDEVISPNETVAALTSDGGVYLNLRNEKRCRASAYSKTGYSDWQDYSLDENLPDPRCFGSVASYEDGKNPYLLIFANCADENNRDHVTVRASMDNGKTFPVARLLDETRGGYVEIATDEREGLIYVLYEEDWGKYDHLAVFNYAWLTAD